MPTRGTAKNRATRSQRSKKVLDAFKEESKIELENPFKPKLEKVVEEKIFIKAVREQQKLSFGPGSKARKNKEPEKSVEEIKEEPAIESIKSENKSDVNSLQNSEIRKISDDVSKRVSMVNIDTKIALEYEEEKT